MTNSDVYGLTFGSTLLINVLIAAGALVIFSGLRHLVSFFFQQQRCKQHTLSRFPWLLDVFLRPLSDFAARGDLALLYILHQTVVLIMLSMFSAFSILVLIPVYRRGTVQGTYSSGWSSITISHIEANSLSYVFPLIVTAVYAVIFLFYYIHTRNFCIHVQQTLSPSQHVLLLHLPKELLQIEKLQSVCQSVYGTSVQSIVPITKQSPKAIKRINKWEKLAQSASVKLCECEWYTCVLEKHTWANSCIQRRVIGRNSIARCHLYHWFYRCWYKLTMQLARYRQIRVHNRLHKSKQAFSAILRKMDSLQMELEMDLFGEPVSAAKYQLYMEQIEYPDFRDYQCLRAVGTESTEGIMEYKNVAGATSDTNQWLNKLDIRSVVLEFKDTTLAQKASQIMFSSNIYKPRVIPISTRHVMWQNLHVSETVKTGLQILYVVVVLVYLALYFLPSTMLINLVNERANQWVWSIYTALCLSQNSTCKQHPSIDGETQMSVGGLNCYVCYKLASYMIVSIPTLITMALNSLLPIVLSTLARICKPVFISSLRIISYYTIFWFLTIIQGILQIVTPSILSSTGVIDYSLILNYSLNQILTQIGRNMPTQVFSFLTYVCTKYFLFSVFSLFRPMDMLTGVINKVVYQRSYWPIRSYSAMSYFNFTRSSAYSSHMICIGLLFGIVAPISLPVVTIAYALMAAVDRYNILYVYPVGDESWLSPSPNILFSVQNTMFVGFSFMLVATGAYYLLLTGYVRIVCFLFNMLILIIILFVKKTSDKKYSINPNHSGAWKESSLERKSIFKISDEVINAASNYTKQESGYITQFHLFDSSEHSDNHSKREGGIQKACGACIRKHVTKEFEDLSRYTRITTGEHR